MQVQTRLTTGEGVAVLNNCYDPFTKIPEKYERAMKPSKGRKLSLADITSATADHATVTEMKHIGSKFCKTIVIFEFISPTVACRPVMLQA